MPEIQQLLALAAKALAPLARLLIVLSPREELYFLYPLTVVPLTVIAYLLHHKNPHRRFSLKRFLRFVFPRRIFLHKSSLLDYRFFAINVFVFATISAVITSGLKWVFPLTTKALIHLCGPVGRPPTSIPWPA